MEALFCGYGPKPTTTEAPTQPTQQTTNRETTTTAESSTQPSQPTQPTQQTTTSKPSPTTTTATENDCSAIFSIESEDVGSWHGLVTLTAETHVQGWEVKMTFTERIDNLESPLAVVSGGGKQWTLSSKSFDDDLEVGTVLELRFEVYYSRNSPDVINIEFNGDELCEEGPPSSTTTQMPTLWRVRILVAGMGSLTSLCLRILWVGNLCLALTTLLITCKLPSEL
eukprot:TRINITY_DN14144_c0_g1_i2.p1 TRINITY_DN14144_c0_g1~~TRINITY_DN14144_c0_g1_i2.p1  ORF type:complete len:225 (-),score=58.51 TRINITY_DN14144_c0_g1_i2:204-878(-)